MKRVVRRVIRRVVPLSFSRGSGRLFAWSLLDLALLDGSFGLGRGYCLG